MTKWVVHSVDPAKREVGVAAPPVVLLEKRAVRRVGAALAKVGFHL